MTLSPLPIRPALPSEPGQEFIDFLDARCGGHRRLRERILVLIQQWDHLVDDYGREPTVEEYALRWGTSLATAYRVLDEFRELFPTEDSPSRLASTLWDGLGHPYWTHPTLGSLLQVRVTARMPAEAPRNTRATRKGGSGE